MYPLDREKKTSRLGGGMKKYRKVKGRKRLALKSVIVGEIK